MHERGQIKTMAPPRNEAVTLRVSPILRRGLNTRDRATQCR